MLKAYQIGERSYASFKAEMLQADPSKKKFEEKMKMNKLKTFSCMTKKTEIKITGMAVILKADNIMFLFGLCIVVAQGIYRLKTSCVTYWVHYHGHCPHQRVL